MTYAKWYDATVSVGDMRKTVIDTGFIKQGEESIENLTNHLDNTLNEICERYVIGSEVGSEGYEHFQCRFVLKKDTWRPQDLILFFHSKGIIGIHLSPTHVRNFDYVEKEGRFLRSWERPLAKYVNITLRRWQEIAIGLWAKQNERQILCIIDTKGAHGKTWLRKHLVATHQARFIPPMEKAEDIMAMALACPAKGYIIDLPRAEGKVKSAIWSAIEQIKDGYLYDKRYQFREKWIEPPKIMVFCNDYDNKNLSEDRWQTFDISDWRNDI